jgi:hypothetical protein
MTTATATWPDSKLLDHLKQGASEFGFALDEVRFAYRDLMDPDEIPGLRPGVRAPTSADAGLLAMIVAHAELELSEIERDIREMRALRDAVALESEGASK